MFLGFMAHQHLRSLAPVMNSIDDYDGQMLFGDLVGVKLPDFCIIGDEKPRKTSHRNLVPTGIRTGTRCVTGAHATSCSTAVDFTVVLIFRWVGEIVGILCETKNACKTLTLKFDPINKCIC